MSSEPRQHHRLPVCYLAGFTPSGRADDQLFVFDFVRGKQWRARPNKVGKRRDYYRVEAEGVDPNYVERMHERFETRIAPILERVRTTHALPHGRELDYLVQFVALLDVRGEEARDRFRSAPLKAAKEFLLRYLHNTQDFQAAVEWLTKGQARIDEPPTPEAVDRFLDTHAQLFRISQEETIRGTHRTMGELTLRDLLERNWALIEGGMANGGLICSDEPVVVAPSDPVRLPERTWKMNDGDTDVTVALDRDLLLLGRYERLDDNSSGTATEIAAANTRTFSNNKHRVYSANPDFFMLGLNGEPVPASELARRNLIAPIPGWLSPL